MGKGHKERDTTGLVLNGTGTQRDRDTTELVLNGTGTQQGWFSMGQGHKAVGTQQDRNTQSGWYSMGQGLKGVGTKMHWDTTGVGHCKTWTETADPGQKLLGCMSRVEGGIKGRGCLLYTSPSPRDFG